MYHRLAGALNIARKDPFGRFLIVQVQAEDTVLVSVEAQFDDFDVKRLW